MRYKTLILFFSLSLLIGMASAASASDVQQYFTLNGTCDPQDVSGNNGDGICKDSPTTGVTGQYNDAYNMGYSSSSGSSGYIDLNGGIDGSYSELSVFMWINPDQDGSSQAWDPWGARNSNDGTGDSWIQHGGFASNGLRFALQNDAGSRTFVDSSSGVASANSWQCVALTWNGSRIKGLYQDSPTGSASQVASGDLSGTVSFDNSSYSQTLGLRKAAIDDGRGDTTGSVDEYRFLNNDLSISEFSDLCETNSLPSGNSAPSLSNPDPSDTAKDVSTSTNLSIDYSDSDGDSGNVTIQWKNGTILKTVTSVSSGSTVSTDSLGLDYGTTYEWYANATDGTDSTSAGNYSFTTKKDTNTSAFCKETVFCTPLNESSSPSIDYSGNNNDLTWNGNPQSASGLFDDSLDFDGSGDYLDTSGDSPAISGFDNFTFAAWVKHDSLTDRQYYMAKGDVGGDSSLFSYALNKEPSGDNHVARLVLSDGSSNYLMEGATSLTSGNWTHVTGRYNGSHMSLYINGSLDNSTSNSPSSINDITKNFYLGYHEDSGGSNEYMNGQIDDVKIFDKALDSSQIFNLASCNEISCSDLQVDLNSPSDSSTKDSPITFNATASTTSDKKLENMTLYGNWTGSWKANETITVSGTSSTQTWSKSISSGTYKWAVKGFDNTTSVFSVNRTFTVQGDPPSISYNSPVDNANVTPNFDLNFSVTCPEGCSRVELYRNSTGVNSYSTTYSRVQSTPIIDLGSGSSWDSEVVQAGTWYINSTDYCHYYAGSDDNDYNGHQTNIGFACGPQPDNLTKISSNPIINRTDFGASDPADGFLPTHLEEPYETNGEEYRLWVTEWVDSGDPDHIVGVFRGTSPTSFDNYTEVLNTKSTQHAPFIYSNPSNTSEDVMVVACRQATSGSFDMCRAKGDESQPFTFSYDSSNSPLFETSDTEVYPHVLYQPNYVSETWSLVYSDYTSNPDISISKVGSDTSFANNDTVFFGLSGSGFDSSYVTTSDIFQEADSSSSGTEYMSYAGRGSRSNYEGVGLASRDFDPADWGENRRSTQVSDGDNLVFNVDWSLGSWKWNAKVVGDDGQTAFVSSNRTLTVDEDSIAPSITIQHPTNTTYGSSSLDLNVTSDEAANYTYNVDGGSNTTVNENDKDLNETLTGLSEGSHTVNVYGNDSSGNIGYSSETFTVNSEAVIEFDGNVQINQTGYSNHNTFINVTKNFNVSSLKVYGKNTTFGDVNWSITGNKTDRIVIELLDFNSSASTGEYLANYSIVSGIGNQIKQTFGGISNDVFHVDKDQSFYSQETPSNNFFDFNYTTEDATFTNFTILNSSNYYPEIKSGYYKLNQSSNTEQIHFTLDSFGENDVTSSQGIGTETSLTNTSMIYSVSLPVQGEYNATDTDGFTSAGFQADLNKTDTGLNGNSSYQHNFSSQGREQEINLTNNEVQQSIDYNITNKLGNNYQGTVKAGENVSISDGDTGDFINENIGTYQVTDSEVVLGFNYTSIYPLEANNTVAANFTDVTTQNLYTEKFACSTLNNTKVDVDGNTDHNFAIGQTCDPGSKGNPVQTVNNVSSDTERVWYNSTDMNISSNETSDTDIVIRADKTSVKNPDNRDGGSLKAIVEGVESTNNNSLNVTDTGSFFRITVGDIQASTLYTDDSDWSVTYTLTGDATNPVTGGGGGTDPTSESQIVFFGNAETSGGVETVNIPFGTEVTRNMTVTNERQSSVTARVSIPDDSQGVCRFISVQRSQNSDQFTKTGQYELGAATQELGTIENTEEFKIKYNIPTRENLTSMGISDLTCEFETSSSFGTAEPLVVDVSRGFQVQDVIDFLATDYCFDIPVGELGTELSNIDDGVLTVCVSVWQFLVLILAVFFGLVFYGSRGGGAGF